MAGKKCVRQIQFNLKGMQLKQKQKRGKKKTYSTF